MEIDQGLKKASAISIEEIYFLIDEFEDYKLVSNKDETFILDHDYSKIAKIKTGFKYVAENNQLIGFINNVLFKLDLDSIY